jgi:hypothetical protein
MSDEYDSTTLGPYNQLNNQPLGPKLPSGQGSPRPQPTPVVKSKLPPVKTKTPVKRIRPNMGGRR